MFRFICHGGTIVSPYDGDVHFISANRVAILHGLNPNDKDVLIVSDKSRNYGIIPSENDVHLWPSKHGKYYNVREKFSV